MLKSIIESLIFAAAKGVNYDTIKSSFGSDYTEKEIKNAINDLQKEYNGEKGIILIEFNKNYQFQSNPLYGEVLADILKPIKERQLSATVLQTLSIIAYRQPITRQEIEEVRSGVSSDYAIGVLLKAELIEPVGRKNTIGKPVLFGTTDAFLKRFRLKTLSDLPDYDKLMESIKNSDKFNEDNENLYSIKQGILPEELEAEEGEEFFEYSSKEETPDFLKDEDFVVIE